MKSADDHLFVIDSDSGYLMTTTTVYTEAGYQYSIIVSAIDNLGKGHQVTTDVKVTLRVF